MGLAVRRHVGGDRFAGNLVCLPEGLYFGRVGPEETLGPLLDDTSPGGFTSTALPRPVRLLVPVPGGRDRSARALWAGRCRAAGLGHAHDGAIELVLDDRLFEVELRAGRR